MLLRVAQVAERLNCSEPTVRSLIDRGILESYRCPGIRVSEAQLAEYLAETKRERRDAPAKKTPRRTQLKHIRL